MLHQRLHRKQLLLDLLLDHLVLKTMGMDPRRWLVVV